MADIGYRGSRAGSAEQISSQQQAAASARAAVEAARISQEMQQSMQQATQNAEENKDRSAINFLYTGDVRRKGWLLTTEKRKYKLKNNLYTEQDKESVEPLVFNVNPASYQFDNPFRQNVVQAKGGPVVHTFRDPKHNNTNLGYPTINIEMSSGSLMPRPNSYKDIKEKNVKYWKPSPNVGNFYKWLEIVQEDTVYQVGDDILPNYQIIEMSTLLFPHITLKGFFVQNANWSENAENPAEIQNWQTQFLIYETYPSLKGQNLSSLYADYEKWYNDYDKPGNSYDYLDNLSPEERRQAFANMTTEEYLEAIRR